MQSPDLQAAVAAWREALGDERVCDDPVSLDRCRCNVGQTERDVPAILHPASTDEVIRVVEIANQHLVPVHPISCGKNWGLGSALPPRDGTCILDLGRMNRILEVNVEHHYAVVEAGVSQGQLYEHLQENGYPLRLNVTGSAATASVVGNALERGIGYFSSRAEDISAMEVVLGNGTVLRTGFGHYENEQVSKVYRYGVGPSLDGLLAQSNYGVVTTACINLIPTPEAHISVVAKISSESGLEALVDAFADLRRSDVIRTVVHIGNKHRGRITLEPLLAERLAAEGMPEEDLRKKVRECFEAGGFGPWSAVVGVMGSRPQVRAAERELKRRLKGVAKVQVLTDKRMALVNKLAQWFGRFPALQSQAALLRALTPLYGLSKGIPTNAPLKSVYWPVCLPDWSDDADPDSGECGMLYCLPFLPLSGADARQVVDLVETVFGEYGFDPYMTLNIVDSKALECVVNLAFHRGSEDRARAAHACIESLQAQLIERGYLPYRVGIQSMQQIISPDDPYWQTVRDLKQVLDPNHIISPGRYNLV